MAKYKAYITNNKYGGKLYHIETPTLHHAYLHESDYLNMISYLENGLQVVRVQGRTTYFNNGARLIDVTMKGSTEKAYCLKDGHMTTNNPKYIKKYLEVMEKEIR